jgi:hypothetical protein
MPSGLIEVKSISGGNVAPTARDPRDGLATMSAMMPS